jgi:hypothetical protein
MGSCALCVPHNKYDVKPLAPQNTYPSVAAVTAVIALEVKTKIRRRESAQVEEADIEALLSASTLQYRLYYRGLLAFAALDLDVDDEDVAQKGPKINPLGGVAFASVHQNSATVTDPDTRQQISPDSIIASHLWPLARASCNEVAAVSHGRGRPG